MYNGGKIILGLVILLVLIAIPMLYNATTGKASFRPDPKVLPGETECVAPGDYMRSAHMDILNEWRDAVVRHGKRYDTFNGEVYELSLSNTCMKCHSNKSEFCDQCHNYTGVNPYCWDCHIEPEEK